MLGILLNRRGGGEELIVRAIDTDNRLHLMRAFGERTGFIPQYSGDFAHALQLQAIANEYAVLRTNFRGDGNHQRNREAQGVRAGDNQQGDCSRNGVI